MTEEASGGGEPPRAEGERRRSPLEWVRAAPKLATGIGAVAAAALSVIALFTWAFPGCSREPQEERSAELTVVQRDPNVRLGAYLRREGRPLEGFGQAALREVGNVFTLDLVLTGVRGQALPLRYSVFDADSRTVVPGTAFDNRQAATLRATSSVTERGGVRVWVPLPGRSGSFFVRFDLYHPEGGLLGTVDSEPFPVTAR